MKNLKVLIVAGGTGGHIFPALAIAQKLQELDTEVLWIGTSDRMEATLVPQYNIPIKFIDIQGIVGHRLSYKLKSITKIGKSITQAVEIIKQFKPDVVICMGGYVCGPCGIAAKSQGVPLIIHEQNGVWGFTNKILKYLANCSLSAFALKGQKAVNIVGQPLRESFNNLDPKENLKNIFNKAITEQQLLFNFLQKNSSNITLNQSVINIDLLNQLEQAVNTNSLLDLSTYQSILSYLSSESKTTFKQQVFNQMPLKVLSVGGSLGAQILNQTVCPAVAEAIKLGYKIQIKQQTGKNNVSVIKNIATKIGLTDVEIVEFITDIQKEYLEHDLIICRSGAITVFEIAACNRYAIFIPYPGQRDRQQYHNAKYIENLHACKIIEQTDLTINTLAQALIEHTYTELYYKIQNLQSFATPQAVNKIVDIIKIEAQKTIR